MSFTGILGFLNGIVLLIWVVRLVQVRRYRAVALHLGTAPPQGQEPLPRLSVVVPARNEEGTVQQAMRTLLALDYPDLEVVAVNDRSTDRTGAILEGLAAGDRRLRVLHVRDLPPGWIGKNHALHVGAQHATGGFILFTDADVHFEPSALRRAVRAALRRNLDHLVLLPQVIVRGFGETLFVSYFGTAFLLALRPWEVEDPTRKAYVGVGAFNLVRADAYRRMGGHGALPMDVVDDVKLGKCLKAAGARQACGFSDGLVCVRWADGLRGMVGGLEKNMFAGLGFRPGAVLGVLATILLLVIGPAVGLAAGPWGVRLLSAAALGVMAGMVRTIRPVPGASPLYGLAFPAAGLLMMAVILRSVYATYRRGGVVWRGTFYPLEDLRRGVV